MAYLIDTDVAIHLRDGDADVTAKVGALDDAIVMSIITRVELEGGVYRVPAQAPVRRARLVVIRQAIPARPVRHQMRMRMSNSSDPPESIIGQWL